MCVIILQLFIIYLATNRGAGDVSRNTTCFSHMETAWNSKKYCTFWYAKNGAIRAQKGVLDLGENRSWKRKWSGLGRRIRKGSKVLLSVTANTHTRAKEVAGRWVQRLTEPACGETSVFPLIVQLSTVTRTHRCFGSLEISVSQRQHRSPKDLVISLACLSHLVKCHRLFRKGSKACCAV